MKVKIILSISFIFNVLSFTVFSQNEKIVEDFMIRMKADLQVFEANTILNYYEINGSRRKNKMRGTFVETNLSFTQKVKHKRQGPKKEVIRVYQKLNDKKFLIYEIVKFDNEIFYIWHEKVVLENDLIVRKYTETYMNKSYEKTTENENSNSVNFIHLLD